MKIQPIDSPLFGSINVGYLYEYNTYAWPATISIPSGLYPQSTALPDVVYYDDILPHLEGKQVTWDIWEQWDNMAFTSMDDVVTALENDNFRPLVTDVCWIFGAPDTGGLGVCKTGNDSYSVIYINGYYTDDDVIRPRCNSMTITHPHGITISNDSYGWEGNTVPPSGTYKTGISFYTSDYVHLTEQGELYSISLSWDNCLHFNTESVFVRCGENLGITPFTDVGPNLGASWNYKFHSALPVGNPIFDRLFWYDPKCYQWHFESFYPYWGLIDITVPSVEGTSLFGGESEVIDNEGNPYEIYKDNQPTGQGGGGSQERYSEDTLPEGVPTINLLNSGFVKLYNPTLAQVEGFARFLFSGINQDMEAVIKRIMVNPIDYVLALNMIHIPLTTTNPADIGFCGISSGVSASVVTQQYYQIEYQVTVNEFWNTALDYSSYTKCRIYVPYCGIYDISIDEIQNGTLWLRYVVDVVSGSVVAFVGTKRTQKDGTVLRATLYQYNGNCILSMPVSSTNWQNIFSSILNIANVSIAPSPSSVGGMANDIMSQKVSVQKSGSISANFGYLGKQQPYIILERPELSIPVNYGKHEGYPANHKRKLSEVHGYTEIKADTLIANGFTGTSEELELLKQALQEGAYLE